jgi:hypothetical protein
MIEAGSNVVPLIWSAAYLKNTLWRTVAGSQKLGAPPSAFSTAGSFHWMPPAGLECSWASPMAWPNSCATVPPSRKPRFMVAWLNGTLRASVPMVDQAPSLSS